MGSFQDWFIHKIWNTKFCKI